MKQEPDRTIAVEDLLRLKRAERPSPGFWNEFDRRLREKQLSALLAPKPWWRSVGLADLWHGLRRLQAPLGATALLAVSLVAWQFDRTRPSQDPATWPSAETAPGAKADSIPVSGDVLAQDGVVSGAMVVAAEAITGGESVGEVDSGAKVIIAEASAASLPRDIPLLGVPSVELREGSTPWSGRLEPAMGVQSEVAEVQLSRSLLSSVARFEARLPAARSPVEPLKQITPPAERRGARILTAMVTVGSVENAMRSTERAASRLSEERLYDQIQRFGARGAGVSVKF